MIFENYKNNSGRSLNPNLDLRKEFSFKVSVRTKAQQYIFCKIMLWRSHKNNIGFWNKRIPFELSPNVSRTFAGMPQHAMPCNDARCRAMPCHAMRQDVFKAPHGCPDAPELSNVFKTYQISQPSTQVSTIGTRTWWVTRKSEKVLHLSSTKKIQIKDSANRKQSFLNFRKT